MLVLPSQYSSEISKYLNVYFNINEITCSCDFIGINTILLLIVDVRAIYVCIP